MSTQRKQRFEPLLENLLPGKSSDLPTANAAGVTTIPEHSPNSCNTSGYSGYVGDTTDETTLE